MGNFVSICGKKEYEMEIQTLRRQLISTNKTLQQSQQFTKEIEEKNEVLLNKNNILQLNNDDLTTKLNHHETILSNYNAVADAIIESDLNCQWMDNTKEKEYLVSIVHFLHVACNDVTGGLKKTPKKLSETPVLKKLDTVDKILMDMHYDSDSSFSDRCSKQRGKI